MKRSLALALQLGFWVVYLIFVASVLFAGTQGAEIPPTDYDYYLAFIFGIAVVPPVLSFYLNYYLLFPRYLQKRRLGWAIVGWVGIACASAGAGLVTILLTNEEAAGCVTTCYPYAISFTIIIAALIGLVSLVIRGFLKWVEELKLKEELLQKNFDMELALVKAQLDPHFLFNTINNIDVLMTKDPEKASNYLNRLSDIMRFMLYESKAPHISLDQELAYINKYVELQKLRTANDSYVDLSIKGETHDKKIAPMVLIPFIENAFKHTPNKKADHAIAVEVAVVEDAIHFICENNYEEDQRKETVGGLGNGLLQRRLQLLYPNRHKLSISQYFNRYRVELSLLYG